MNNDFQMINQIETEIEKAVKFCEKNYSKEEIFDILKKSSDEYPDIDIEKQICILKIDCISSQKEADILIFHLTNHTALVREASAQKVNEFMKNAKSTAFFQTKNIINSLLKAVNDINPNICRLIIEILPYIKDKDFFLSGLYERIDDVFDELEKLKRSNWYTKKLFNLYWCLEALAVLKAPVDKRLEYVLSKAGAFKDYTIREKTAMVLHYMTDTSPLIVELKEKLKNDNNFYVKRYSQQW